MNLGMSWVEIIGFLAGIVIAISFHEYAHAYIANRLGDPTPRFAGRLTLNPLAHLDILGTITLLVAGFGWGKPVPVNNLILKTRANQAKVAVAGPIANFIIALIFAIPYRVAVYLNINPTVGSFFIICNAITDINLILMSFNLIPLPPLDGSHILGAIIPKSWLEAYETLESAGPYILFAIIFFEVITHIQIIERVVIPVFVFFRYLARGFPAMLF